MSTSLQAPFPYFGGKSRIAHEVWARFGDVANYVEPFFGSGAVLLARPTAPRIETVNDKDGYISNFWRAVQHDPDGVAHHADWPVIECDKHARELWLVGQHDSMVDRLSGDPDWYDTKIAGWWCWGMCAYIGGGFCSGNGPWRSVDGRLVNVREMGGNGDAGRGINRQLPHLGNAGQGINRQLPHLGSAGVGNAILDWMRALSERLRRVRVCNGDWARVCGPSVTFRLGVTGVFLDPPYSASAGWSAGLYREEQDIAHEVAAWALEMGEREDMRIAMCGYEGSHEFPPDWECLAWKTQGGYGSQGNGTRGAANSNRERIWFSPACIKQDLFALATQEESNQ